MHINVNFCLKFVRTRNTVSHDHHHHHLSNLITSKTFIIAQSSHKLTESKFKVYQRFFNRNSTVASKGPPDSKKHLNCIRNHQRLVTGI